MIAALSIVMLGLLAVLIRRHTEDEAIRRFQVSLAIPLSAENVSRVLVRRGTLHVLPALFPCSDVWSEKAAEALNPCLRVGDHLAFRVPLSEILTVAPSASADPEGRHLREMLSKEVVDLVCVEATGGVVLYMATGSANRAGRLPLERLKTILGDAGVVVKELV